VLRSILDDGEKVCTLERVPASEDEFWHLHLCNLVDEVKCLGCREFQRMAVGPRIHAAVHALQIASLGRFPNYDGGALVEAPQLEACEIIRHCLCRVHRGLAAAAEATMLIAS
jgi:hypothetical protein